MRHEAWLAGLRLDDPAMRATAHYRGVLAARDAELRALEADLAGYFTAAPFAGQVRRLTAYRGVTGLLRSPWPARWSSGARGVRID